MSGKQFFVDRYRELGWEFRSVQLRQAIRVNTLNVDQTHLVRRLESRGVTLSKVPFLENGFWVEESGFSLGATSEYLLGLYSMQEAAAQIPATLFKNVTDATVLDACAAPGGKTVQLANLMKGHGAIIAADIDSERLAALGNHLERCNVGNVVVYCLDARRVSHLETRFDHVLLDVPCSGNFAGDQDWFRNRTLRDVETNAGLQREILKEAAKVLRPGGEIVYSTCSLEPEEDEFNVQWAIVNLGLVPQSINCLGAAGLTEIFGRELDSSMVNCRRIWPNETQGFFVCKFRRG